MRKKELNMAHNSDARMYQAAMKDITDKNGNPFYVGVLDGNPLTKGTSSTNTRTLAEAVNAFQIEKGIKVSGVIAVNDKTFKAMESDLSTTDLIDMNAMETRIKTKEVPVFSCDDTKLNLDVFDPATLPLPMRLSTEIFQRIVQLKKVSKFPVHFKASDCDINTAGNYTIHFKFKDIKWLKKGPSFDAVMPWPAKNELILELGISSEKIWQYDKSSKPNYTVKSEKAYPYLVGLPAYDASKHPPAIGLKSGVTHVIAQKACVAAALQMKGGARYKDDAKSEKIFIELTSIVTGLDTKLADALKALGKAVRAKNTFGGFPIIKFKNCNKTNSKLLTFLMKAEGKHLGKNGKHIPYDDDTGNCTIGYGRLLHSNICTPADRIAHGGGIDEAIASKNLADDIKNKGTDPLKDHVFKTKMDVVMTQPMYDALVSLVYNVGTGSGGIQAKDQLIKDIENGEFEKAANEILKYNRGAGKVNRGLTNRRVADRDIFLYGEY